jgi:hypothetical protein
MDKQQQKSTEYYDGQEQYLKAMFHESIRCPESVNWIEVDKVMEQIHERYLDVDMAQSEYTDWRG